MKRHVIVAVIVSAVLVGCGKREPVKPAVGQSAKPPDSTATAAVAPVASAASATPSPVAQKAAVAPTAAVKPVAEASVPTHAPAASPAESAEFKARMEALLALERDLDFEGAMRMCGEMQSVFRAPEHAGILNETMGRLQNENQTAASRNLRFAVEQLGSAESRTRDVAAQVLSASGETGLLFLRHACRTKDGQIARAAAEVLGGIGDADVFPILLAKITSDPQSAGAVIAAQTFVRAVRKLDNTVISNCLAVVTADRRFEIPHVVDVLETYLTRVCLYKEQAFNAAVGRPDGMDAFRDYIGMALVSTNPALVAWACQRSPALLPHRDNFRVRYYANTGFSNAVVDRIESGVDFIVRNAPLPGDRRNNISVRWTCDVFVRHPGDHRIGFRSDPRVPRSLRVWIDDKQVGEFPEGAGWDPSLVIRLKEGWHTLRIDYVKGDANNVDGDLTRFEWNGPKVEGAQGPAVLFSQCLRYDDAVALGRAVTELGSKEWPVAKAARRRLAEAQDQGRLFLFHALDTQTGAVRQRAMDELCEQVRLFEPRRFAVLYNKAMAADAGPMNPYVSILCAALSERCESDPGKLNSLLGSPEAHGKLKAHVEAALMSDDPVVVAGACQRGQPFAPVLQGLRARYYADPDYRELAVERLDSRIEINKPRYPVPPDRQGRVSAEWSGWLVIDKPAEYAFLPEARGQAAFSVDGTPLGWDMRMKLAIGRHRCSVSFRQADTNADSGISFTWQGVGMGRRPVEPFVSAPSDSKLAELAKAMDDLNSTNTVQVQAAQEILRAAAPVSAIILRNAFRSASAKAAAAMAPLVATLRVRDAAPMLLARLKSETAPELTAAFADALCIVADGVPPGEFPGLYKAAVAPGATPVNLHVAILCAALDCQNLTADTFNKWVDDPKGYQTLEAHVKAALKSSSPEIAVRADRYGGGFVPIRAGLVYEYYEGCGPNVPDFKTLRPVARGIVGKVDLSPRKRDESMGFRFSGLINVPADGVYTFFISSDDGSRLSIDGVRVVDNDGPHGMEEKAGTTKLKAGRHDIIIDYAQGNAALGLSAGWQGPGIAKQEIPANVLFHRTQVAEGASSSDAGKKP